MKKKEEKAESRVATFPAAIPPTESAIKFSGDGGARLTLDVGEANMGAFVPVLAMRGKRLMVTITEA